MLKIIQILKNNIKNFRIILFILLITFFLSCQDESDIINGDSDNNALNDSSLLIEKSLSLLDDIAYPANGKFTFAIIADSHNGFEQLQESVDLLNSDDDILFVIHAGDLSYGGNKEHLVKSRNILGMLTKPIFTVQGNHECVKSAPDSYMQMYGPSTYEFIFGDNLFMFINDNFKYIECESVFAWIKETILSSKEMQKMFITGHSPPGDNRMFNDYEESTYKDIVSDYNIDLSIHGHWHEFSISGYNNEGSTYLVCGALSKRTFCKIHVTSSGYEIEEVFF